MLNLDCKFEQLLEALQFFPVLRVCLIKLRNAIYVLVTVSRLKNP